MDAAAVSLHSIMLTQVNDVFVTGWYFMGIDETVVSGGIDEGSEVPGSERPAVEFQGHLHGGMSAVPAEYGVFQGRSIPAVPLVWRLGGEPEDRQGLLFLVLPGRGMQGFKG
jgi:hypothetical protein